MFFEFALSLRGAGMGLSDIEDTLQAEAIEELDVDLPLIFSGAVFEVDARRRREGERFLGLNHRPS